MFGMYFRYSLMTWHWLLMIPESNCIEAATSTQIKLYLYFRDLGDDTVFTDFVLGCRGSFAENDMKLYVGTQKIAKELCNKGNANIRIFRSYHLPSILKDVDIDGQLHYKLHKDFERRSVLTDQRMWNRCYTQGVKSRGLCWKHFEINWKTTHSQELNFSAEKLSR